MIKFRKSDVLDITMEKLLQSMVEVNDYLNDILNYTEKVLTPKMEKELINILKKYNVSYSLKYDIGLLTDNPYFKNIDLDRVSTSTVNYDKIAIKKRTLMSMDFHQPMGEYLFHHHPIGYFDRDVDMPVLMERDKVWMSPAISEIQSMRDGIQKGRGKCMTMGLGIGVLPYLWLLKKEVESVTIVEFNRDVIDLFENFIQPQFKTHKKLEIIHGNAFDYFNEDFLNQFDYSYIDFWESSEDGLEYYTKLMEKNIDLSNVDYWIEDSILYNLKYMIVPYLYTIYAGSSIVEFISSIESDLKEQAKKINRYFKSKNDTIETKEELLALIHDKQVLRNILGQ